MNPILYDYRFRNFLTIFKKNSHLYCKFSKLRYNIKIERKNVTLSLNGISFFPDQVLTKTRAVFILRFVIVKPSIYYPFETRPILQKLCSI